jgi:hypothetical protein
MTTLMRRPLTNQLHNNVKMTVDIKKDDIEEEEEMN